MKTTCATFVDLVCDRAQREPNRVAYRFLKNGETLQATLTYGALDQQARGIARHLSTLAAVGDRALLVYPYEASLDFITAFLGCLYAGIIAVPTHPPRNRSGKEDLLGRITSSGARLWLTTRTLQRAIARQLTDAAEGEWVTTDDLPLAASDWRSDWQRPNLQPDSLAFLQYTSGSTGLPKGVEITHRALLHNQQLLKLAFDHDDTLVGVGWLPLFHDMGLIGNVLQPLYVGGNCVLMSPVAFVQKPVRWLQALSRYGGTTSGGPNFAYDLLCRYVSDAQCQTLDLSRWQVAFTGAEPVRATTLDQFTTKFSSCGFRHAAFYPCYGMAEATLFITGGKASEPPRIVYASETALATGRVDCSDAPALGRRALVGCGQPWLDGRVAIAHPASGQPCEPDEIGEIWVAGSGLGRGYWQQPEASDRTFGAHMTTGEGPFLRTGDLGFLYRDELFVTGRLNDILVFFGLNHYPEHLERTVADCHPGLRAGGGAAIAVPIEGRDRLVVVQEVERRYRDLTAQEVAEAVRWALFDEHFVDVWAVVLLKPGGLPRTSSGKVQRRACRDRYLIGDLPILSEWRSPQVLDMRSLVRRYFNPTVHLRRLYGRVSLSLRRHLQQIREDEP